MYKLKYFEHFSDTFLNKIMNNVPTHSFIHFFAEQLLQVQTQACVLRHENE